MTLVPAMDAVYLWGESGASPSHVVALQIFRPRADAGPELLDELYAKMTDESQLKRTFRRRPQRSLSTAGQFSWVIEQGVDMPLQVRRAGLRRPGRVRELLEFVAQYHEVPLERDRPLWEACLVEGLADGRFALCTKMHHAMFDGVNMGRHLLGGLSTDPADRTGAAPWIMPGGRPGRRRRPSGAVDVVREAASTVAGVAGSVPSLLRAGRDVVGGKGSPPPFAAPPTILNGRVSSARRFAGDEWPKERLRAVARARGTTVNDVAIAMCAGALRGYLAEYAALPKDSLVAMVPISFDPSSGGEVRDGNAWGAVLCDLVTNTDDVLDRLTRIADSTRRSKEMMAGLDPVAAQTVSAMTLGAAVLAMVPGLPMLPRPPFNLIISTIPPVKETLYLDGCEMTDVYPVSVVVDGQALNITMCTYGDRLAFGITGCRRSVPSLQRLLVHLENSLTELEKCALVSA